MHEEDSQSVTDRHVNRRYNASSVAVAHLIQKGAVSALQFLLTWPIKGTSPRCKRAQL